MIVSLDIGSEPAARVAASTSRNHPFVLKIGDNKDRVEIHLPSGGLTAVFSALRAFLATADPGPSATFSVERALVAWNQGKVARALYDDAVAAKSEPKLISFIKGRFDLFASEYGPAPHLWSAFVNGFFDFDQPPA